MDLRTAGMVFLSGGAGALSRVLAAGFLERQLGSAMQGAGTLLVNLAGCFLIGLVLSGFPESSFRTAVVGGFLGGFTTYSAFAWMTVQMAQDSKWTTFGTQLVVHIVGGIICVWLGSRVVRLFG